MALSDLAVFTEYAYKAKTEVLAQQLALFNSATRGAIALRQAANQGDYNEAAFFGKVSGGLVVRRNAYGTGANSTAVMAQLTDRSVKVGAGTKTIALDPGQFKWIQQNPSVAGAAMGQQLAADDMADMLNTSIAAGYAAIAQVTANVYDGTAAVANHAALLQGSAKMGDMAANVLCWVLHSKVHTDIIAGNLTNAQNLFKFGDVNVMADFQGRPLIVTDSASLFTVDGVGAGVNKYHTLGLVSEGIVIEQNNDFTDNWETSNGQINIARTYQAEWTYNLGIKGFAWDKTNGGHSPTTAALTTATNWDKFATSSKDIAGVVVESR